MKNNIKMEKKSLLSILGVIALLFVCYLMCKKRYKVYSLVGGNEYIDITSFVSSGEYKPYYCPLNSNDLDDLVGLKKANPENLPSENSDTLLSLCREWLDENNMYCGELQLLKTNYAHTYFMHNKTPYHVFQVNFLCDQTDLALYIRQTENGLFDTFSKYGWVTCSEK
jgi:hypothetical protein